MRIHPTAAAAAMLLPFAAQGAEPLKLSISGYMNAGIGVANQEGSDTDFGVMRDGEIHFKVLGASDNGLTFRAQVELEAWTTSDQIDENWVSVSGAWGNLLIGGADTALNEMGGVGVVYPTGSYLNYYDGDTSNVPGDPGPFIGKDDAVSVRYWYEYSGFTIGASFQPNGDADGVYDTNALSTRNGPPSTGGDDQWAVGASYETEFDAWGFAVGGGYLRSDTLEQAHAGAEVSLHGFTLAGFWDTQAVTGGPTDYDRYGIGAMYATGPWSVGGGYVFTDIRNQPGAENEDFVHFGGGYDLAPGITTYAAVQWGRNQRDNEGFGAYTWINLRF